MFLGVDREGLYGSLAERLMLARQKTQGAICKLSSSNVAQGEGEGKARSESLPGCGDSEAFSDSVDGPRRASFCSLQLPIVTATACNRGRCWGLGR